MVKFLLILWQLPQEVIGLILRLAYPNSRTLYVDGIRYFYNPYFKGGISLGSVIILGTRDADSVRHEHGHQLQSLYLGWLYLLVVGLPSLIWAAVCKDRKKYYRFYTEKWADKLGKVERN